MPVAVSRSGVSRSVTNRQPSRQTGVRWRKVYVPSSSTPNAAVTVPRPATEASTAKSRTGSPAWAPVTSTSRVTSGPSRTTGGREGGCSTPATRRASRLPYSGSQSTTAGSRVASTASFGASPGAPAGTRATAIAKRPSGSAARTACSSCCLATGTTDTTRGAPVLIRAARSRSCAATSAPHTA